KAMTPRALDAAKKQFLGQLCVASDNFEQTAIGAGRATLFRGYAATADQIRQSILAVTPEQIRLTAEALTHLSTLTLTLTLTP
ncbi:MAG: hypothetical protein K2M98_05520, partial [Muribaculum sp.]|nr:hypothetical protein [Muribaculum sp.]